VLLSDGRGRVGYLLKDRVASLDVLVDALRTITAGGTVLDPEVVAQLRWHGGLTRWRRSRRRSAMCSD
jgi:DNA-binding NarL/FixJ family response regulator